MNLNYQMTHVNNNTNKWGLLLLLKDSNGAIKQFIPYYLKPDILEDKSK